MSLEFHRRAEKLMWQADRLAAQGKSEQAAEHYRAAAVEEAAAYEHVPPDWGRTRGVLAVSAVALYRKAGEREHATRLAEQYLTHDGLPEPSRRDLQAIVDEVEGESAASNETQRPGSRAFVGHASQDRSTVEALDRELRGRGVET